jgi:hypothetical protein
MLGAISEALEPRGEGDEESGIQQGGVRYGAVSHCCTRSLLLLGSPIRCCAMVDDEKSLVQPVYEVYEDRVKRRPAWRSRERDIVFSGRGLRPIRRPR